VHQQRGSRGAGSPHHQQRRPQQLGLQGQRLSVEYPAFSEESQQRFGSQHHHLADEESGGDNDSTRSGGWSSRHQAVAYLPDGGADCSSSASLLTFAPGQLLDLASPQPTHRDGQEDQHVQMQPQQHQQQDDDHQSLQQPSQQQEQQQQHLMMQQMQAYGWPMMVAAVPWDMTKSTMPCVMMPMEAIVPMSPSVACSHQQQHQPPPQQQQQLQLQQLQQQQLQQQQQQSPVPQQFFQPMPIGGTPSGAGGAVAANTMWLRSNEPYSD
jgi:hypothetical protein